VISHFDFFPSHKKNLRSPQTTKNMMGDSSSSDDDTLEDIVAWCDDEDDDMDDDADVLLLVALRFLNRYVAAMPAPSRRQFIPNQRLDLATMTEFDCRRDFRMSADELPALTLALGLGGHFKNAARDSFFGFEGVCLVLRRLVFPSRWSDLSKQFGRGQAQLCRIFWSTARFILHFFKHLLRFNPLLFRNRLAEFAAACRAIHGYDVDIVAFVDGTVRKTCRPLPGSLPAGCNEYALQRAAYNGHKKYSCSSIVCVCVGVCVERPMRVCVRFTLL
jgi:hypothetical protein